MSKMDGLRAMREAKYEKAAARARSAPPSGASPRPASTPTKSQSAQSQSAQSQSAQTEPTTSSEGAEPAEALCGHRNMSGRTCTREHGHAAKSHRYS